MTRYITAPDHVSACALGPATVLVNYETGAVQALTGSSAHWWGELAATGDTATPTMLDAQSAQALTRQLHAAGFLVFTDSARPWHGPATGRPLLASWGVDEVQVGRAPLPAVPVRVLVLAAVALAVVLAVRHIGRSGRSMARLTQLLAWTAKRTVRPASEEHARHVVYAVRRVGFLAPNRVACLEESAAAVLALAAFRERVTWCHGAAADPISLHAWVEVEGQPVAEPPSTLRYAALRSI